MVEVLCGVMSGGTWGPNIRQWGKCDKPGGLSHCFLALDPGVCGDGFKERMQELMRTFRGLNPAEDDKPVLVPGDPERTRERKVLESGGVRYTGSQYSRFKHFSEKFGVSPPHATVLWYQENPAMYCSYASYSFAIGFCCQNIHYISFFLTFLFDISCNSWICVTTFRAYFRR